MGKVNKNKTLSWVFGLSAFFIMVDVVNKLIGNPNYYILDMLKAYTPFLLLIFLVSWTLTYGRALFFIVLAGITGLIFEMIGLVYGTFFGGAYVYGKDVFEVFIHGVPIMVPVYWAIFIYTGYAISNTFIKWIGVSKPNIRTNKSIFLLLLLILLDGTLVTAIDVFMDPLSVRSGSWTWLGEGSYFGIPIGNFVGWFIVTIIVSSIYRIFEFFRPQKESELSDWFILIPVIGYVLIFLSFLAKSLKYEMYEMSLIGFFVMMPIVIVNILLFHYRKK